MRASRQGLCVPAVVIGVAATVVWLAGPQGPGRHRAVLVAAGVCLAGTAAAWFVGLRPATTAAGRAALPLAATALRLAPALALLAWLQTHGADLRAVGTGELLLGFYLAGLAADVIRIIIEQRISA